MYKTNFSRYIGRGFLLTSIGCLFMGSYLMAQSGIDVVQKTHATDAAFITKLKTFKKQGYEKDLPLEKITPDQFISSAKKYLGTPYKFGGMSNAGIDCSGLIAKSFGDIGVTVPHSAQELARFGRIIVDRDDIQVGDVIFFTSTYNTSKLVTHAGFCIEEGKMIHASSSKGVMISKFEDPYYWNKHYLFATRIFAVEKNVQEVVIAEKVEPVKKKIRKLSPLSKGYKEKVIASIYNKKRRGRFTETGEKYNAADFTAGHKYIPIGSLVRVFNPKTGKAIVVRINDLEFKDNSLVLSKKAFKTLKIKKKDQSEMELEVISVP